MRTITKLAGYFFFIIFFAGCSSAQTDPVWSPDSKKIAYTLETRGGDESADRELHIMTRDGSKDINLINCGRTNPSPKWSPNGNKIAFVSSKNSLKQKQVCLVDVNDSKSIQLTNTKEANYGPEWSPDGRKIAFVSERDGYSEIYVMNPDGSNQARLTNTNSNNYGPAWSPAGGKIAFVSKRDGHSEIYVMNPDGSNQTRLTRIQAMTGHAWSSQHTWSPDGTKIAYVSTPNGTECEIWVVLADGSKQTNYTKVPALINYKTGNYLRAGDFWPQWFQGGKSIIFESTVYELTMPITFGKTEGGWRYVRKAYVLSKIFVKGINEAEPRLLDFKEEREDSPRPSPDGKSLAHVSGGSFSKKIRIIKLE